MKNIGSPLTESDARSLSAGDSITLTGKIFTARDEAHIHALSFNEKGLAMPFDLKGAAVFHCGPIMRKVGDGWEVVAAGPTTSSRMNSLEPDFIRKFGARAIIGKGGMSKDTIDAMAEFGCVYLALTGGAAVLAARGIVNVAGVHWFELGMPEAVWELDVKDFGPLTVAIDSHGNSLYEDVGLDVQRNLPAIRKKLGID